jgi:hypothetical protein
MCFAMALSCETLRTLESRLDHILSSSCVDVACGGVEKVAYDFVKERCEAAYSVSWRFTVSAEKRNNKAGLFAVIMSKFVKSDTAELSYSITVGKIPIVFLYIDNNGFRLESAGRVITYTPSLDNTRNLPYDHGIMVQTYSNSDFAAGSAALDETKSAVVTFLRNCAKALYH